MKSHWNETTLGKIVEFYNGKSIKPGGFGTFPVYGSNGLIGMSDEFLYENAIIIGRVGAYCGSVDYCDSQFWASDNTIVAKPFDGVSDTLFTYYLLNTAKLNQYAGGAAQPLVTQSNLRNVRIRIPDLPTQRRIASILSAYDDLIENNTRRIKILEEMARLIYREWFVEFRAPGVRLRKATPEEKKVTGKDVFPEGWEVRRLGDVLSELESGSRPKGGIDNADTEVPSIGAENIIGLGQYDYSKEKFISRDFFENMNRGHIQSGDVLLYKDGASLGRKSMFRDGFPHEECCVNEHVFILRTNDRCSQNYLYLWLDLPQMTSNIKNLNANAAQPGINQVGVKGLSIQCPPITVVKAFNDIVDPIFAEIFNLAKKNQNLHLTRDLLLPKLMSGDIILD